MSEWRLVDVYRLSVCEGGHVQNAEPTGEKRWMIPCPHCETYTWEDGRFCVWCGQPLYPEPDPLEDRREKQEGRPA